MGWNKNGSRPSGFTLRNATCTTSGHGDNTGIVHSRGGSSYGTIENCELIGAGIFRHCGPDGDALCLNNTGVIIFQGRGWVIKNNIVHNFNTGIFFNKHPNPKSDHDFQVVNNWIYDCDLAIRTSTNYTLFSNNILDGRVDTGYNGGCAADKNCGSDFNTFTHNTFLGRVTLEDQTSPGDDKYIGAQYNTFKDNIFILTFWPIPWDLSDHYSILDYNLYPTGGAVYSNRRSYSLGDWQGGYGQDEHSLAGAPTFFVDSPTAIEDYRLDSKSIGYKKASDGTDLGADVSFVGP